MKRTTIALIILSHIAHSYAVAFLWHLNPLFERSEWWEWPTWLLQISFMCSYPAYRLCWVADEKWKSA